MLKRRWEKNNIHIDKMSRPCRHITKHGSFHILRAPGEVLMENKVARTYLRREDFEQRGLSEGFLGCRHLRTGQGRQQPHSEACQRRIEGLCKEYIFHYRKWLRKLYVYSTNINMSNEDNKHDTNYINKHKDANHDTRKLHL